MFKIDTRGECQFRITDGALWFWLRRPGSYHFVPLAFFSDQGTFGL